MNTHFYLFAFLPILLLSLNSCIDKSQISTVDIPTDTVYLHHHEAPDAKFPEDWVGFYEGEMDWHSQGKLNAKIPVTIEIAKIDSLENTWLWKTIYDSTERVPRRVVKEYWVIKPDSLADHQFIMDERNGILLDMNLIDNTFYTSFEVASNRLLSTSRLVHDKLYHEILMSPLAKSRKSYAVEGKDTFHVEGLKDIVVQKAVLTLKK
jgi:hypothetical protein